MQKPGSIRTTVGFQETDLRQITRTVGVPTVEAFWNVAKKSQLISPPALESLQRGFRIDKTTQPKTIANKLVSERHVTPWQAEQLLAGRTRFGAGSHHHLFRKRQFAKLHARAAG